MFWKVLDPHDTSSPSLKVTLKAKTFEPASGPVWSVADSVVRTPAWQLLELQQQVASSVVIPASSLVQG